MNKAVEKLNSELVRLANYELFFVEFLPTCSGIRLKFSYGGAKASISELILYNAVQLSISRTPDTEESSYYVGEIALKKLSDGGQVLLRKFGHSFLEQNGEIAKYQDIPLYHIHIEGEICIDVVCSNVTLKTRGDVISAHDITN